MRISQPQPPLEQILKSDTFRQRIYVQEALYALDRVLPQNLAAIVREELDFSRNFSDRFGSSPRVLHAASEILDLEKERKSEQ